MKRKAIFLLLFFVVAIKAQSAETDLLISEIMYDVSGVDGGHEWIEIFNSSQESITASSTWRFFDGSNHSLSLYQGSSTISGYEFVILADNAENFLLDYPDFSGTVFDTVMSLPNSSSSLAIGFDNGESYPVLSDYNSLWGGGDGMSLEKITLNKDSQESNWQTSYVVGGTPGHPNSTSSIEEVSEENNQENLWPQIIISEFIPDPEGSDDEEWIEIYNVNDELVELENFALGDNSLRRFVFDDSLVIEAKSYLLLEKETTGISLNNSGGDSVKIYNPNEELQEEVNYQDCIEGRSYARREDAFVWTKSPTPGRNNEFIFNQAPVAQISVETEELFVDKNISFSGENSYDEEDENLEYFWNFGDGNTANKKNTKHKFENIGSYTVVLRVEDKEGLGDTTEFEIEIISESILTEPEAELKKKTENQKENKVVEIDFSEDDLIISEFIPNPIGSDDNEWVELYNQSDKNIDLSGWYLDDIDGGSKPYNFVTSTIARKDFLLVTREKSKITLNNSNDSVRLIDPNKQIWQQVEYEKIPEGSSYAWDFENREWFVADKPSPGSINLNVVVDEEREIYFVPQVFELEKNEEVLVQGLAINSSDGDSRSVYLVDFDGDKVYYDSLVEVYSYYKDFPQIRPGQVLTVSGKISKTGDIPRLKIKNASDVLVSDMKIELTDREVIDVFDISEDYLGDFVTIGGVVVKKSGKNIYIAEDEEEDYLLRAYLKFSSKELDIKKGSEVIISGILSESNNGFKLTPFKLADVFVSKEVLGEKISEEAEKVDIDLSKEEHKVSSSDKEFATKNVLIFSLLGLICLVVVYFLKKRLKN
ncbi:hypothetical protein C0580_03265 [Candidatus Parcubacteria bacterium]|mgnify:CR=1 FL=1|nr:MAG: hypothetical protein C0580_03265 [Candidatus Parcubacteria bacterium]